MKKLRHIFHVSFFVTLILLTACNQIDIVHDLQERDANEILVILNQHDIHAEKEKSEKNQEVTWIVKVESSDEQLARSVLVANNLPRVRLGGLKGICQDAGMILTPKTEKCRELLAAKEEIINLIESVACVMSADVVLNIPDKEEFPDENTIILHPTATASVKYLKDCMADTKLNEERVQDIVASAVSGLDPRDVAVVISYLDSGLPAANRNVSADDKPVEKCPDAAVATADGQPVALSQVAGLTMDAESAQKFKMITLAFLVLFLLIVAAFVFVLFKMAKIRRAAGSKALVKAELGEGEKPKES